MKYIQIFLVWHLLFAISCNSSKDVFNKKGMYKSQGLALRDYAFCQCIHFASKADSIQLNDVSIPVIFELSNYSIPLNKRNKIDSLAKSYADGIQKLQSGDYGSKRAAILHCLNFYRSKALQKAIHEP